MHLPMARLFALGAAFVLFGGCDAKHPLDPPTETTTPHGRSNPAFRAGDVDGASPPPPRAITRSHDQQHPPEIAADARPQPLTAGSG